MILCINCKKIGGFLTETKVVSEVVRYLVVGIGINTYKKIFTEDIKNIASSIMVEFSINIDKNNFIIDFCNVFEKEIIKRPDIKSQ